VRCPTQPVKWGTPGVPPGIGTYRMLAHMDTRRACLGASNGE